MLSLNVSKCKLATSGQRKSVASQSSNTNSKTSIKCEASKREVTLLDYGAGNVRSVRNAITKLGYSIKDVTKPQDIVNAEKLIFPGVGSFGQAMDILQKKKYVDPLMEYLKSDRPFLGICLGLQLLFEGSEESGGCEGLGLIPGRVTKFDASLGLPVPHIGWNTLNVRNPSALLLSDVGARRVYYVHSFRATPSSRNGDWVLATSPYGGDFVAAVNKGNVSATQFHPEKSGRTGLDVLGRFLDPTVAPTSSPSLSSPSSSSSATGLARRVIACLDVRSNDKGDLVVTKGDQYDVREKTEGNEVRNLGKPVELSARYYNEGADEVTFLNITGFRDCPLQDLPMIQVLQQASERVFVPLTVGGGIRGFTDANGISSSALEVAAQYFRSGADKVSIGSDAVEAAIELRQRGGKLLGDTAIEQISKVYGRQAVVVSVDPRRVYVKSPSDVPHQTVKTAKKGPAGEEYCWWQCTVKGGREGRDLGAIELAKAVELMGAGEILLNCIDNDGAKKGFDLELVDAVAKAVEIPVIASSGAGCPAHFSDVFKKTGAAAALAAGIFHRNEVSIQDVKETMDRDGIPTRLGQ
uniref:Imidazole glycerol phosphate synthase hisHF n=1 Tax=Polytomella parva TaxID=51329 RepID=A0A7S0V8H8_9CHLO|mmetsp:Transcript_32610/g.59152  ORF Transcript_32610/g.59152 Transcript_32610/m.59152 type:complete len:581 (+) Transcript_32610:63-1805(+)